MPEPVEFPEQNSLLTAPTGMPDVYDLHCFVGRDLSERIHHVSVWQFTPEEIAALIENGGKLYMGIISSGLPPSYLTVKDPISDFLKPIF